MTHNHKTPSQSGSNWNTDVLAKAWLSHDCQKLLPPKNESETFQYKWNVLTQEVT